MSSALSSFSDELPNNELMSSSPSSKLTSDQKQKWLQNVQHTMEVQNLQELIKRMSAKCFKTCVTRPGVQLGSSEQKCISNCMDRYLESVEIVSKAYIDRINSGMNGSSSAMM